MLKHLPEISLVSLLEIFNNIWQTGNFPSDWAEAIVIPFPKPEKDHSKPENYRPIALTSCLCKTFERMVNARLTWFLESNGVLTELQSGFRKGRSTTDQLVRLESFVREAFVRGEHAVAVFFDLEKAYDTTWKYGILQDLENSGLKGRLPIFIANFLANRKFRVRAGSHLSDTFKQEMGVPQGSILSVTLFVLKINNIVRCLPAGVRGSLFVDDFLICYRSRIMHSIERVLQGCLGKIESWADTNGFRFSTSKTVCMHFCTKRIPHADPCLTLYNSEIPVVSETKFLGLIFDSKLSFKAHIDYLKKKCLKAMNLLRVVSNTDWGADSTTLLRLYRSLVRSKLDYGCVVYGSARDSYLQSLDRVQNAALRVCLGAFRTSPITSLHVEANELPLQLRRQKLALQYVVKLRSNPRNPAYASVFQPNFKHSFEARPSVIPTLGLRMHQALVDCGVELGCRAQYSIPSSPPWLLHRPYFDYTLYNLGTKSETLPDLYLSRYKELVSSYQIHEKIFTDGSKKGSAVSAAAVTFGKVLVKRLPDHSSIFSAESRAVLLALDIMRQSCDRRFLVISDSLSCLKSLENRNFQNPFILEILETLDKLSRSGYSITFLWVPSHIGIEGNGAADATAKAALNLRVAKSPVPYSDFKPLVCAYVNSVWQKCWDGETNNKLHRLQPVIGTYRQGKHTRRDEVVIHRLRIGHSHLTHNYLLKKEQAPVCQPCNAPLTVEHMLISCSKYVTQRRKYFQNCICLEDLFNSFSCSVIIDYAKEIGIYRKL
jgi:ribonuclease HI